MTNLTADVIIVGGGIAGLNCARHLYRQGVDVLVLEADDDIGGRIRTDTVDGFLLDRGFQVLQTAYPELENSLDLRALNLKPFDPGVIIRKNGRFRILADPIRAPRYLLHSLLSGIGTVSDKLRVMRLFWRLYQDGPKKFLAQKDMKTVTYLNNLDFSNDMIQSFFKPFFAGVSLDPDINVSSRVFNYLLYMFARGQACLPEAGMAAIPRQIASTLPNKRIETRARVQTISENTVILEDDRRLNSKTIVLATDAGETGRLLGESNTVPYFSEYCVYFAAEKPPLPHNMLMLNGTDKGPVTNLAIPSQAAEQYAPPGQTLIAAVVIGISEISENDLLDQVFIQMQDWFGKAVDKWLHLKTYHILRALPDQRPPQPIPFEASPQIHRNIYACGEYRSVPSIQWALFSGRKTAESILKENIYS